MSLDKFKLSSSVKTGIWVEFSEDVKFLVAHSGRANQKSQAVFERTYKPVRHQMRTGTLSNEKAEELEIEYLAEAIILDWYVVDNGVELPFNKENVKRILREYPVILDTINKTSSDIQNYIESSVKEDAGK